MLVEGDSMNLHALRYFIEVAKTKSFTEASKRLFISQPGISQQIDLLEKQLGITLLHRTTRKVELTEEGKYLFDKTLSSFNEIEDTVAHIVENSTFPGLINIATVPSAASLYLPNLLKEIHALHPDIEFKIQETTTKNVMNAINNRTSHLGFIRTTDEPHLLAQADMDHLEFENSPIKAVVSTEHQLASESSIHLEQLRDDFFIQYNATESTTLFNQIEAACIAAGFKPKVICSGSELLTISNMISQNLAVALMPENMLDLVSNNLVTSLPINGLNMTSSISAIWKDDGYVNLNSKLVIDILKQMQTNHTLK